MTAYVIRNQGEFEAVAKRAKADNIRLAKLEAERKAAGQAAKEQAEAPFLIEINLLRVGVEDDRALLRDYVEDAYRNGESIEFPGGVSRYRDLTVVVDSLVDLCKAIAEDEELQYGEPLVKPAIGPLKNVLKNRAIPGVRLEEGWGVAIQQKE